MKGSIELKNQLSKWVRETDGILDRQRKSTLSKGGLGSIEGEGDRACKRQCRAEESTKLRDTRL